MAEMLILRGLPGSGKSTHAKAWVMEDPDGRVRVNYDDMRRERFGPNWTFNRKQETEIKVAATEIAINALKAGLSVVIDNTNLSESVRNSWRRVGEANGATVTEEHIDTPLHACIHNDAGRRTKADGMVGRAVIERMALFNDLIPDLKPKACSCAQRQFADGLHNSYCPAIQKDLVLVDIDGTVADISHRLHHIRPDCLVCKYRHHDGGSCCGTKLKKNWPAFYREIGSDKPNKPVADMVKHLEQRYDIIFVTGRDTSIGIETESWLGKHGFIYSHLFMRQSGDHRPDYEAKKEILDRLPKSRIAFAIEDRKQVVDMYRKEGVTVLQCAEGDF